MNGRKLLLKQIPLPLLTTAFGAGILVSYRTSFPFGIVACVTLFILIVLFLSISRRFFPLASCFLFFILGIFSGTNNQARSDQDAGLSAMNGYVVIEGTVASVPETVTKGKKETLSFVLNAEDVFRKGVLAPLRGKIQVFLLNSRTAIRFGDRLRLRGILEDPKRARNFYGFDYAAYLSQRGIFKVFRGIGPSAVLKQRAAGRRRWSFWAHDLRRHLDERLAALLPFPHDEIASALMFGFRRNIPQNLQDAFVQTGTAHLLAISGLNISLVSGMFYFLARLLRLVRPLNLMFTMLFIAFYTVLAGANIPVLRAAVMGISVLFGFLIGRDRNLKQALFLALLVLLAGDPAVLFSASFQLSFLAMASLIFVLPGFERLARHSAHEESSSIWVKLLENIRQTFLASLAVMVGMFPVLLWYFHLFSPIGFLANLVAIPVSTLGILSAFVLLILDAVFPILAPASSVATAFLFQLEMWWIVQLARIPFGFFYLPHPSWLFIVFYYGALALWLWTLHRRIPEWFRLGCLAAVFGVTLLFCAGRGEAPFRMVFFDVGKTDCAFIQFSSGARLLVNSGRAFPGDQAYWVLRPFLAASGVRRLDGILFSRLDGAHAGGLVTLAKHFLFRNVFFPRGGKSRISESRYLAPYAIRKLNLRELSRGDLLEFGPDSKIEILDVSDRGVLSFSVQDDLVRMLYVGSLRPNFFQALVQSHPEETLYDVVFLPHGETILTEEEILFLKRLRPRFLVLNQRDDIRTLRLRLGPFLDSQLLFIEDTGAIEFYRHRNRLHCQWFLKSSEKTSFFLKPKPAYY